MNDLTAQQIDFCHHYLIERNGTKACIAAKYAENSAHVQANRLLKNDKILALIDTMQADSLARVELSVDKVNTILAGMIETDTHDLYYEGADGELIPKPMSELTSAQRHAVKGVTLQNRIMEAKNGAMLTEQTHKLDLHDRVKAIDMFYKRNGDYSDGTVNNFAIGHVTQLQVNANRRRAGRAVEDDDG